MEAIVKDIEKSTVVRRSMKQVHITSAVCGASRIRRVWRRCIVWARRLSAIMRYQIVQLQRHRNKELSSKQRSMPAHKFDDSEKIHSEETFQGILDAERVQTELQMYLRRLHFVGRFLEITSAAPNQNYLSLGQNCIELHAVYLLAISVCTASLFALPFRSQTSTPTSGVRTNKLQG